MLSQIDRFILYICLYSILFIYFTIFSVSFVSGQTVDLGQVGNTWSVIEQDVTEELKTTARKSFDAAIGDIRRNIKKYQPAEGVYRLPPCEKNASFAVDMTWTLGRDLRDGNGKIIYPAGYRFNPLEYVSFTQILVVLDATNPDQMAWFTQSPYGTDGRVLLLLSDGYAFDVMSRLNRPVYYLSKTIAERLKLRSVPSVVHSVNKKMEVFELNVKGWAKKQKRTDTHEKP